MLSQSLFYHSEALLGMLFCKGQLPFIYIYSWLGVGGQGGEEFQLHCFPQLVHVTSVLNRLKSSSGALKGKVFNSFQCHSTSTYIMAAILPLWVVILRPE